MEASDQTPTPNTEDLDAREADLKAREQAILEKEAQLTAEEQSAVDRQKDAQAKLKEATGGELPVNSDEVRALGAAFAEYRKEVAALRKELAASRGPRALTVAAVESPDDRRNARLEQIAEHSHYCPGCGKLGKYPQQCTGYVAAPHAAIEMVSTEELGGDPDDHTAAPSTELAA